MNDNRLLMLLDMNNIATMAVGRAPLKYKGVRTDVLSISLAMLRRYLTNFQPDSTVCVYDSGRDVRRTSVYPEYKRRPKKPLTPAELKERHLFFKQLKILQTNLHRLGFTQVRCRGREADDTIFSLTAQAMRTAGQQVLVVSSDKDFFQLFQHFGSRVKVYNPVKDVFYNEAGAEQVMGVPMEWYLAYRAMTGDMGDNIPGVKGLGPKKAQQIVEMMTREGDLTEAEQKLLVFLNDNERAFELMKFLITFLPIKEAELQAGTSQKELSAMDKSEQLMALCYRYGMQQFIDDFPAASDGFRQYWVREDNAKKE